MSEDPYMLYRKVEGLCVEKRRLEARVQSLEEEVALLKDEALDQEFDSRFGTGIELI